MSQKRKIVVIVGSKSDLPQCRLGLTILKGDIERGAIEDVRVIVASIHRNSAFLLDGQDAAGVLRQLSETGDTDVIISAAGWANHLTGMIDAYLRYNIGDDKIVVVGEAIEDVSNEKHTQAAMLSISEVPGTQVVYIPEFSDKQFVGQEGFAAACIFAVSGDLPKIKIPAPKETHEWLLSEMDLNNL